jgi:hypothetical protein
MNIPNTMMRNVNNRRGGMWSAALFVVEGDGVSASAMVHPERAPGLRPAT